MIDIPDPPPSLFRLFIRMGGWLVLIAGAFLLLLTLISHLALQTAKRFEREGIMATAQVSEKYTTTSTDSDGDKTISYWLTFTYITAGKDEITLTETVSTALYRSVEPGRSFDLLYLESEPDRVETSPGSNRSASRFTQIAALAFGSLWLFGLWKVGGWAVAAVRARRYGRREMATVTDIARTGVKINNRPRYRVVWTDGQGKEGKSLLHKSGDLSGLRGGDEIVIYQGVKLSWWAGDVGERDGP